jgi:hypothetical protein
MMLTLQTLDKILTEISHLGTTLADVVIMTVSDPNARAHHPHVTLHIEDLLNTLYRHNPIHEQVSTWAHTTMKAIYTSEILSLTQPKSGLHYTAKGMTEDKMGKFDIDDITEHMSADAPLLWELLGKLLSADPLRRQTWRKQDLTQKQEREDDVYWEFLDQTLPIVEENQDEPEDILDQVEQRHSSLIAIVRLSSYNTCVSTIYYHG